MHIEFFTVLAIKYYHVSIWIIFSLDQLSTFIYIYIYIYKTEYTTDRALSRDSSRNI